MACAAYLKKRLKTQPMNKKLFHWSVSQSLSGMTFRMEIVQSVPTSLKSLVSILLHGPNIKLHILAHITICQLIMFK